MRNDESTLARPAEFARRALLLLALLAVFVAAGIWLASVLVPVLLAIVVVPVARPLQERLEGRLPASMSAALVLLLAFLVLAAAGWLMVASIAANWSALSAGISDAIGTLASWVEDQVQGLDSSQVDAAAEDVQELVGSLTAVLVGGVGRGVLVVGTLLVSLFLFLVTFFFGLRDWDRFTGWTVQNAGSSYGSSTSLFLERYVVIMRLYWKSQALLGLFDALAIGVGLWLIGVPLALPIAVVTFVISFIPYLGAIIAGALAVFVALGTGGSGDALLALLLSLVVFNTAENLIRPWLIGETIEMPTFVAFLASTLGVLIAGALGATLAVPLVALVGEARRIHGDTTEPDSMPGSADVGSADPAVT